jgi:DedD protein
MDRQLAERMVGAACLLAVLVLVVPSILDGNQQPEDSGSELLQSAAPDLRTHTLTLDSAGRVPPVPRLRDAPREEPAGTLPDEQPPAEETVAPVALQEVTPPAPPEVANPPVTTATATEKVAAVPPVVKAPAVADTGQWYVQLGSFSSQQNAERLVAKLKAGGFDATIRKGSNGSMLRVLVGPQADRDAAVALSGKLSAAGFAGQLTRL